jgi:hypothetical protein
MQLSQQECATTQRRLADSNGAGLSPESHCNYGRKTDLPF